MRVCCVALREDDAEAVEDLRGLLRSQQLGAARGLLEVTDQHLHATATGRHKAGGPLSLEAESLSRFSLRFLILAQA